MTDIQRHNIRLLFPLFRSLPKERRALTAAGLRDGSLGVFTASVLSLMTDKAALAAIAAAAERSQT